MPNASSSNLYWNVSKLGPALGDSSWVIRKYRQSHGQFDHPRFYISDDFKHHLLDAGINIESGEHLPEECPEESEFITWSENVKKIKLNVDSQTGIPEIATAAIKGTWQVKKGTTGAVLLMNKPRMKRITSDVLGKLATLRLFQSTCLVTKAVYCPAFSMYLSDTSGESFSTPLYMNFCMRGALVIGERHHPQYAQVKCFTPVPWVPLGEDGTEVPIYIRSKERM
ncbi:uncharacterized protein HD556DRAFT_622215 [Suillus plorans]|uniref:Uncharacterized protein n=1 Tax=Suillus plorans TaxID=116603 RepID=A0A9P7AN17_9AGAM|nr:uncharacterized protein HD556DRAFT_622215 [Suillus plorans]KAG1791833.1 hypothetical protein HD556DRAFT_622215 [Suillus plorans]